MEFRENNGIYQQIADYCIDRVLGGDWVAGERIPSVRQLAAEIGVNPNTVQRAYAYLQEIGIAETRRGLGVFVPDDGRANARQLRRREFVTFQLPELTRTLELLDISTEDLVDLIMTVKV